MRQRLQVDTAILENWAKYIVLVFQLVDRLRAMTCSDERQENRFELST
jgi:hypothetical protein